MKTALRLAFSVARSFTDDIRAIARRRVLRALDELLHGAPCRCCAQDEETDP